MLTTLLRQLGQMLTWFIIVAPWEQAIRIRLGKNKKLLTAGIYLRIPFFDRVFKQSVRRRVHIITPQTLTTLDGRVVTCGGAVGFTITDLYKFYDSIESPNDTISNETGGLIAKYIASKRLAECNAKELEEFVMSNLKLDRYGLSGKQFFITQFACTKAYRFITGEIPSWMCDGRISMAHTDMPTQ